MQYSLECIENFGKKNYNAYLNNYFERIFDLRERNA